AEVVLINRAGCLQEIRTCQSLSRFETLCFGFGASLACEHTKRRRRGRGKSERGYHRPCDAHRSSVLPHLLTADILLAHIVKDSRNVGNAVSKARMAERELVVLAGPAQIHVARLFAVH